MFNKICLLTGALLCLASNPVSAKQISITYDGSCETAVFGLDKTFKNQGDPNVWSYVGTGTGLCGNFFGVGFKVKAKIEGIDSTWLLFSIHSTDSPNYQLAVAVQYPVESGKLTVAYEVASDQSVHFSSLGTYTVNAAP